MTCIAPFPFRLQGTRTQHLSSINLYGRIATAELVWIHFPEGSVEYNPHLCKEIMMKEKAKERWIGKIPELCHEKSVEAGAVLQRGKRRGNIPGSAQRKGSPAAAARGEWGKHK